VTGERTGPRILEPAHRLRSIPTRRSLLPPPATASDAPRWEASWRHLLEVYAPAMRRYVAALLASATRAPANPDDAADVVSEYLAACLAKGWLSREVGEVRCFRAFLQVQLRRFTWSWVRDRAALRRSPGRPPTEDGLDTAASPEGDPAEALDRGLVASAVERAVARLRAGNEVYGEIVADLLRTDGEGSADLAQRLARAPADLPLLRHRARRRFAVLFTEELRATVRDDESFDELLARLEPLLP
jgi:DNA-directed RNA polymerase specialized sigma24 family protein